MQAQVKEVQEVMLRHKLKPVKEHLDYWKERITLKNSGNAFAATQQLKLDYAISANSNNMVGH